MFLWSIAILSSILYRCHATNAYDGIGHARAQGHHDIIQDRRQRWLQKQRLMVPSFLKRRARVDGCGVESCLLQLRGGDGMMHNRVHAATGNAIIQTSQQEVQQKTQTTPSKNQNQNQQQSPFEYIPITALDDYGQSTQLRHAMESANRFGTPVLACICCHYNEDENGNHEVDENENVSRDANNTVDRNNKRRMENAIVVCSLQRPRPGVISPTPSTQNSLPITIKGSSSDTKIHPSIQGMVKLLATRDDYQHPSSHYNNNDDNSNSVPKQHHALHTAIITTGIQSDASFLLEKLQTHLVSKYWFRYDTLPTSASTKMVRDVLLDCLGYDWREEVTSGKISGGVGSAAPSYEDEDDDYGGGGSSSRAGRPLGVCTFLLGLDDNDAISRPSLTVIKANGSSNQYVAHAMGMGSQLANEKLSQQWKRHMSRDEAKAMMIGILKDVAKERGWISSVEEGDGDNAGNSAEGRIRSLTVACETVTSRGIDIEFSML